MMAVSIRAALAITTLGAIFRGEPMTQQPVRLGVVGAGGFTRRFHLPNFLKIPGVEVVAVCNRSEESGQEVAREFNFSTVLTDWRELVTLPQVDAVVIGTWPYMHAPVAVAVVMDNADSPELDAGRALQQMELLAWSEGLGTCFVGFPLDSQQQQVKEVLGIPARMELITVLPFGYRPDGITGRFKSKRRKRLSDIAHRGRFGEKYVLT